MTIQELEQEIEAMYALEKIARPVSVPLANQVQRLAVAMEMVKHNPSQANVRLVEELTAKMEAEVRELEEKNDRDLDDLFMKITGKPRRSVDTPPTESTD